MGGGGIAFMITAFTAHLAQHSLPTLAARPKGGLTARRRAPPGGPTAPVGSADCWPVGHARCLPGGCQAWTAGLGRARTAAVLQLVPLTFLTARIVALAWV